MKQSRVGCREKIQGLIVGVTKRSLRYTNRVSVLFKLHRLHLEYDGLRTINQELKTITTVISEP